MRLFKHCAHWQPFSYDAFASPHLSACCGAVWLGCTVYVPVVESTQRALEESHRGDIKCGIRAFKTGIGEKRVSGDILNLSSVRNCREWGRGPRKLQPNGSMRKKFWGEICWRGQVIAR